MADPFIRGEHASASMRLDDSPIELLAKSIRIEQLGSVADDGICGDVRQFFQTICDGYRITFSNFHRDSKRLAALLADRANEDAGVAPFINLIGIKFRYRDGSTYVCVAKEVTIDPWSVDIGGRRERVMDDLKLTARFFEPAKSTG